MGGQLIWALGLSGNPPLCVLMLSVLQLYCCIVENKPSLSLVGQRDWLETKPEAGRSSSQTIRYTLLKVYGMWRSTYRWLAANNSPMTACLYTRCVCLFACLCLSIHELHTVPVRDGTGSPGQRFVWVGSRVSDPVFDPVFTARRNARIASAVLATAIPSVCLSVSLSVRPSATRRYCVKTTART